MHNEPLEKPPYPVDSADRALRLIHLLRDLGSVRVKDAAAELGVAPSTAHRLFAVLVHRGFAVQDESRAYLPGPALGAQPAELRWARELRAATQPHLERLTGLLNETTTLVIRVGTMVHFIGCVEGSNVLRVSDRQGAVLPARHTSGGKALLAELPARLLDRLYGQEQSFPGSDPLAVADRQGLQTELAGVRGNGYAANLDGTEDGVSAIGAALHDAAGKPIGAISVAVPTARYKRALEGPLIPALLAERAEFDEQVRATPTRFA